MIDSQRRAWTVNLAARRVSLSRSTLYKMMAAGTLAHVKVGSRRLIRDDELEKLIAPLSGTTVPPASTSLVSDHDHWRRGPKRRRPRLSFGTNHNKSIRGGRSDMIEEPPNAKALFLAFEEHRLESFWRYLRAFEHERRNTERRQRNYFFHDVDSQALPVPRKLRRPGGIGTRTVDSIGAKAMVYDLWFQAEPIRKEDKA